MADSPREITLPIDVNINQGDFFQVDPKYATFPYVSFDGFNFHLVFLVTTPTPSQSEEKPQAEVVARLVLPPPTVVATLQALQEAFDNPTPEGIFAPLVSLEDQAVQGSDATNKGVDSQEMESNE